MNCFAYYLNFEISYKEHRSRTHQRELHKIVNFLLTFLNNLFSTAAIVMLQLPPEKNVR
jgi:uncharacterized protein YecE (DUF72 family)